MIPADKLVSPYTNRTSYQRVRLYCETRPDHLPTAYEILRTRELTAICLPVCLPRGSASAGKCALTRVIEAYRVE